MADGEEITWNFAKFLVCNSSGKVTYYEPKVDPDDMRKDIESML